jgi:hypothetical protein
VPSGVLRPLLEAALPGAADRADLWRGARFGAVDTVAVVTVAVATAAVTVTCGAGDCVCRRRL